jgi:hypothetical protein
MRVPGGAAGGLRVVRPGGNLWKASGCAVSPNPHYVRSSTERGNYSVSELWKLDACGQAELVRKRKVTAAELVQAAIARIEQLNPRVNAVVTPLFDRAHAQVSRGIPAGPFGGVPLLLKDFLCETAGDPYYEGSRFLRDLAWHSPADSDLASRFRQAGFVVLGRTNVPEFAASATTEPAAFGPTRNPWNPERSAGGSSGGSAAAVACAFEELNGNIAKAAELVPADRFAWRPVGTVRSVGQVVGHVTDAYLYYCGRAAGRPMQWSDAIAEGPIDKSALLAKLNDAAAQCGAAFEKGNVGLLVVNYGHANLHYGNLVTYLRLLGFVPPTSG